MRSTGSRGVLPPSTQLNTSGMSGERVGDRLDLRLGLRRLDEQEVGAALAIAGARSSA